MNQPIFFLPSEFSFLLIKSVSAAVVIVALFVFMRQKKGLPDFWGISYNKLIVVITVFYVALAGYFTGFQYFLWSSSAYTKIFLQWNYFLFHVGVDFWLDPALTF